MQPLRSAFAALACLGLLGSQLSGVHMHVDAHGYVGVPTTTHVHGNANHSHDHPSHAHTGDHGHSGDHEGRRDIAAAKLGAGASKLLILLTWVALALVIERAVGANLLPPLVSRPRRRRIHWRPPLRAPPPLAP